MTEKTVKDEPIVEVDEAAIARRQAETAAWLEDPTNQAAMAEGKRALELEMAEADKRKRRQKPVAEPDAELDAEPDTALVATVSVTEVELAPVWTAPARMAVKPADPDDSFSVGEVLEVIVELYDRPDGYVLAIVMPDGERDELPAEETRDGWAPAIAMRNIKIDPEADWQTFNALPAEHPVKERRRLAQLRRIERLNENRPVGEVRSREIYRDRDPRTGEFSIFSDGSSTWW
jgi:hypothetical protein